MIQEVKTFTKSLDWILIMLVGILPVIGLAVLYSASFDPDIEHRFFFWSFNSHLVFRQLNYFLISLVFMFIVASIPPRLSYRFAHVAYASALLLLLSVLVYGTISNGSRRWLHLGFINLQPSELMKVGVILALARYLSRVPPKDGLYTCKELFMPACIVLLPMLVILRQPDLGTALSIGAIGASMILFIGVKRSVLFGLSIFSTIGGAVGWLWFLHPYQKKRILTMFNPEADPRGSGYQIIQSKIAVGSGELFGKGYLEGSQTRLEFIPERTTDFIFSVFAEEWGFLGSMVILGLYLLLLFRLLTQSTKAKEYFGVLVTVGVVGMIFFHVFVNLGMVVGFLPVVGLPLPLMSYGGSSLMTTFFSIGLALSVTAQRSVFSYR